MLKLLLLLPIVAFFVVFGILGISKHIVIAILFLSIAACIFILFCILLGVSIYKKSVTKNGFETEATILGFIDTLAGKYETHDFDEALPHGAYVLRIEFLCSWYTKMNIDLFFYLILRCMPAQILRANHTIKKMRYSVYISLNTYHQYKL